MNQEKRELAEGFWVRVIGDTRAAGLVAQLSKSPSGLKQSWTLAGYAGWQFWRDALEVFPFQPGDTVRDHMGIFRKVLGYDPRTGIKGADALIVLEALPGEGCDVIHYEVGGTRYKALQRIVFEPRTVTTNSTGVAKTEPVQCPQDGCPSCVMKGCSNVCPDKYRMYAAEHYTKIFDNPESVDDFYRTYQEKLDGIDGGGLTIPARAAKAAREEAESALRFKPGFCWHCGHDRGCWHPRKKV